MTNRKNRSEKADVAKLTGLRTFLGWTQEEAAAKAGYSSRLIRKVELGGKLRPKTLVQILACYHDALKIPSWQAEDFFSNDGDQLSQSKNEACIQRIYEYFEVVRCCANSKTKTDILALAKQRSFLRSGN